MDETGSSVLVFRLGDEHGLEVGQGGEDAPAHPGRELSLRWINNIDLHGAGSQGYDLLL